MGSRNARPATAQARHEHARGPIPPSARAPAPPRARARVYADFRLSHAAAGRRLSALVELGSLFAVSSARPLIALVPKLLRRPGMDRRHRAQPHDRRDDDTRLARRRNAARLQPRARPLLGPQASRSPGGRPHDRADHHRLGRDLWNLCQAQADRRLVRHRARPHDPGAAVRDHHPGRGPARARREPGAGRARARRIALAGDPTRHAARNPPEHRDRGRACLHHLVRRACRRDVPGGSANDVAQEDVRQYPHGNRPDHRGRIGAADSDHHGRAADRAALWPRRERDGRERVRRRGDRMAGDALFHPEFKASPFWWEAWRPSADGSADLPARADVAIVGAGYGGLATALELRRAGTDVVVIEANEFGSGASSRNGGAVSGGINLGKGLSGRRGADQDEIARAAAAMLADAADSLLLLEEIIVRENIECCYERRGRLVGAYTPRHYDDLARKLDALNRDAHGEAYMLAKARQHEEIASGFYYGGRVVRRSGKLHPALYCRGLLDACRHSRSR